jgi:catechol 2,3-dioxygenase-like lactoylglutathione lyase family enzyme
MHVLGIDHMNIGGSAALVEACRNFYVDVLGLREGPRPPFRSRGFWLYAGDAPVIHLTERAHGLETQPPGTLDHYAMRCTGLDEAVARLDRHGVPYTREEVPAQNQTQLFVHDPAGIAIELNFSE